MKRLSLLLVTVFVTIVCFAQSSSVIIKEGKNSATIGINTDSMLEFSCSLANFEIQPTFADGNYYSRIICDGYIPDNRTGYPQLPVFVRVIEVPMGAEIVSSYSVNSKTTVSLEEKDSPYPIFPNQLAVFKNQRREDIPFVKNDIYNSTEIYSPQILKVEEAGVMRGIRLVKVIVNPFEYDIADNVLIVSNEISVKLQFKDADSRSNYVKSSKYSPAFRGMYGRIWNYKSTRDAESRYPIKYVVISDPMFAETLQPFIAWKIKKGFDVIVAYTDVIGNTTSAIKSYLQGLYDAATAENPAPSYVLYVGDVAQIPVWDTRVSGEDHITDVYNVCFDGRDDYIPDMFFGRFSAQNVAQLEPQIEKTLMFEQYTFSDPSYLEDAVIVAGADRNYGPTYANGQANYAHQYYFNEAHNVNASVYLYPESESSSSAILTELGKGVGYVNYSAHCDYDGWYSPAFNLSDIPGLQNDGAYFFSVGNCCLSNKFNVDECFGEALLRTQGKGAVCHIGGTNSTIWDEDYYWSVGVTASISANPTYESTGIAAYDQLFHENGEAPHMTAGEMIFAGNWSVNSSTSDYIQYYWEIYTCMGDPSLMPYVGVPSPLVAEYSNTIPIGSVNLEVETEDLTYVALSKDGVLLGAQYTGNSSVAELEFPALTEACELDIVITRQFRAPHIQRISVVEGENLNDVSIQSVVNPIANISSAEATFSPKVVIMNLATQNMTSATVSYNIDDGDEVVYHWTGDLLQYATAEITFDEISLDLGSHVFTFTASNPNGVADEDDTNNTRARTTTVSNGSVAVLNIADPNGSYCGYLEIVPSFKVKNNSAFVVTSLTARYTYGEEEVQKTFSCSIAPNATATLAFDPMEVGLGDGEITISVISVNGGANLDTNVQTSTFDVVSHDGEGFRLNLLADYYAAQISWDITQDETVVYSGNDYSYTGVADIEDFCLPAGCYTFNLRDSNGNGLSGISFWGYTIGTGSASFVNMNTGETLLSVTSSDAYSVKSVDFCVAGISDVEFPDDFSFEAYPNPTNGVLNIAGNNIDKIEVYNSLGKMVISRQVCSQSANINLGGLSSGLYFVKIYGATTETMKVVVER